MGIFNRQKKEKIERATKKMEQMEQDKRILRYLVIDSEVIARSTAIKDPYGCRYIYIKSGGQSSYAGAHISNVDFVQGIFAQYKINLKKHVSHLDGEETEVLCMGVSDYNKLPDLQKNFLDEIAPTSRVYGERDRALMDRSSEIVNEIALKPKYGISKDQAYESR